MATAKKTETKAAEKKAEVKTEAKVEVKAEPAKASDKSIKIKMTKLVISKKAILKRIVNTHFLRSTQNSLLLTGRQ